VIVEKDCGLVFNDPIGFQELPGYAARPTFARTDENAPALEFAQILDWHITAREDPDWLVEQPSDRVQLGVFQVSAPLYLCGEASLETGNEVTLYEPSVYL